MLSIVTLLSLIGGFAGEISAQSIIISVDGINQEADTLDFGARTVNNPKVDSFFVVNNTNDTLYIPEDAFFMNLITAKDTYDTFAEFELEKTQNEKRPHSIPPNSRYAIKVKFKLDTINVNNAAFAPDKYLKKARVIVHLNKVIANDTSKVVYRDTIFVSGDRTERFMKPNDSLFVFDSLYFGQKETDTVIIYNGTSTNSINISISENKKNDITISPQDIGDFTLQSNSVKKIPIAILANTPGVNKYDSVLNIESSPEFNGTIKEKSNISLRSFVAIQKLEIDSANTVNPDPTLKDNVKFLNNRTLEILENVPIDSTSKLYTIAVQNNGNIPLNIDSIVVSGDTSGFTVDFTNLSKNLSLQRPTTSFTALFHPKKQPGDWKVTIAFHTDLKKRFPNLPLNSKDDIQTITIKGNAIAAEPVLMALKDGCDTFYISSSTDKDCNLGCVRTFMMRNIGESVLRIDSFFFDDNSLEFRTNSQQKDLEPGDSLPIKVIFQPGTKAGTFTNTFKVNTNRGSFSQNVSFTSILSSAIISFDTIYAKPGELISIPIHVQSDQLERAQYFIAEYTIPEKYRNSLRFETLDLSGSAAERATPSVTKRLVPSSGNPSKKDEIITFGVNPTGSFENFNNTGNTLGALRFTYFLNEQPETELLINTYKLGTFTTTDNSLDPIFCDDFFNVTFPKKIIIKPEEYSLCADQGTLDALFADIRKNLIAFSAGVPLFGESVVEIQHSIPNAVHSEISLYSVTGEKIESIFSGIASTELTKIRHPLSHLNKGVYYCELKTGGYRKAIPIIITR
jgi:hypothetical protein